MPRRTDINRILVIGSGPITIGQACEFDYSGTQACKVLKEDGFEVVLVNSNPATIMTDPSMATRTYVEPITAATVEKIIEKERPDALLPTLGGQTALNCAVELARLGVLDKYKVEMIGCDLDAINKGEDRKEFAKAMSEIGLECARSGYAYTVDDALELSEQLGFPLVLRPSYTLGGAGGGIAFNRQELIDIVRQGLDLSPAGEVLVEESIIGWKEYEMEVMRDKAGNAIIICSIENFDAMGVHTGDSITVAPSQTMTDIEYQRMRVASLAILEKIGVETGGSNVQFAVNPVDGRMIVIEMNPRVSRSSALASKATGFPIAKAAAKLAVGYTLAEITNDITKATPACFEPTIDYVVVKVPRFAFEKFKGTDETLTTRMKAVGEVMAIGRTFDEALNKAMRSLENGRDGLGCDGRDSFDEESFATMLAKPTENRIYYMIEAIRRGMSVEEVASQTSVDPWFISRLAHIVRVEQMVAAHKLDGLSPDDMRIAKQTGLSDRQIAYLTGEYDLQHMDSASVEAAELRVRARRKALGVLPSFKTVDTCGAEFESITNYYYKTYEDESEVKSCDKPKAMILGAGPNRIGQGIEFDYCCVHASYALADMGYETIMVNSNPETVSTDYDTSDRLYFEPLTFEDVMDIVEAENPDGVVVTLGGQTPLKLAHALEKAGMEIMGTKPDAIDLAEDRERFSTLLDEMNIDYPPSGVASSFDEAVEVAHKIGFPLLVRPSYVLGGRGMMIAYDADSLKRYMAQAVRVSPDMPIYLDKFLESAVELDVDALCDGEQVYIGGVMEHIEEAGIHSGDSACCIPPFSISEEIHDRIRNITRRLGMTLGVRGLMNIQFAVKDSTIYVIEVNPRASRTVPFVSKATGVPLAKCAAMVMAGRTIESLELPSDDREINHYSVKEAVMPFGRFPGADFVLGPEMKSTGEVMGIAHDFPSAYAKTALAIDYSLPTAGKAFVSVCDRDKRSIIAIARDLSKLGFEIVCTLGTAQSLKASGVPVTVINKYQEARPNIGDAIANGEIALIINTPFGQRTRSDGYLLRADAVRYSICYVTTISAAQAMVSAIEAVQESGVSEGRMAPICLQDLDRYDLVSIPVGGESESGSCGSGDSGSCGSR